MSDYTRQFRFFFLIFLYPEDVNLQLYNLFERNSLRYLVAAKEMRDGKPVVSGFLILRNKANVINVREMLPGDRLTVNAAPRNWQSKIARQFILKGDMTVGQWNMYKTSSSVYGKHADYIEYGELPYFKKPAYITEESPLNRMLRMIRDGFAWDKLSLFDGETFILYQEQLKEYYSLNSPNRVKVCSEH